MRSKIDYVFEELHGYASIRDPETGVEVRSYPMFHVSVYENGVVRSVLMNACGGLTP